MPISIGDILRITLTFAMPEEVVAINTFGFIVDALNSTDEGDVLDDMKLIMNDYFDELVDTMSNGVATETIAMAVRDVGAGQWNTVAQDVFTDIVGNLGVSPVPQGTGSQITIYGDVPRRRTRTFYPGLAATQFVNGSLSPTAFADLVLATGDRIIPNVAPNGAYSPGFFSPSTNQFIQVTGNSVRINSLMGYNRRRKPGVGI